MTRSFLQFAGFASAVVWSTLLIGTLLTAPARAEVVVITTTQGPEDSCTNCYGCDAMKPCAYVGSGDGCTTKTRTCDCRKRQGEHFCSRSR